MTTRLQQTLVSLSSYLFLGVLLVLSLVFMTVYSQEDEEGFFHTIQSNVSGAFVPLKFVGGAVGAGTDSVGTTIENASASSDDIASLRAYSEELLEEIAKLEEYRQEAQRYAALLELKDSYDLETISARVISRSSNAWERVISIDKGTEDGIVTGLPVMGTSGIVGQVISTTAHSSDIRLITDSQSGVSVLIQSNREEGIVRGSLEGLLYLDSISADVQVQVGDVIVTSGLGGSYFRGLMVGIVVRVEENQGGLTRKIVVSPNSDARPLEEVLVVTKMNSEGDAAINEAVEPNPDDENVNGENNNSEGGTSE